MTHSASIEWLCEHAGLLRLHAGPDGQVGDPYVWCVTLDRHGDTAILKGVVRAVPLGAARAVCEALHAAGITERVHERHSAGGVRTVAKKV